MAARWLPDKIPRNHLIIGDKQPIVEYLNPALILECVCVSLLVFQVQVQGGGSHGGRPSSPPFLLSSHGSGPSSTLSGEYPPHSPVALHCTDKQTHMTDVNTMHVGPAACSLASLTAQICPGSAALPCTCRKRPHPQQRGRSRGSEINLGC